MVTGLQGESPLAKCAHTIILVLDLSFWLDLSTEKIISPEFILMITNFGETRSGELSSGSKSYGKSPTVSARQEVESPSLRNTFPTPSRMSTSYDPEAQPVTGVGASERHQEFQLHDIGEERVERPQDHTTTQSPGM